MEIIVNGEIIAKEICNQEVQNVWRSNRELPDDQIKEIASQNIIDWTIIRQQATKTIKHVPPAEIDKALQELKASHGGDEQFYSSFNITPKDDNKVKTDLETNIKVTQFLTDLTKDVQEPDDKAIEAYYNEHTEEFTNPEQIHAAHIVRPVDPRNARELYKEMLEIRTKLLNGAEFSDIADQHSSCDDNGGDLGTFAPGQMVEEFDTVVFSMNEGEVSPIFLTQFGYHIAKVYEKFPASEKPLKDCRDDILDRLATDLKDDHIAAWVDTVKKTADIQIKD